MQQTISTEQVMTSIVEAIENKKANHIVTMDLRGVSLIADYFIICHGNSDVQVQAIATEAKKVAQLQGIPIRGLEGMDAARWVLLDLGDVVLHVFHRDEREYYHIERLWSDAKIVERVQ